MIIEGSAPGSIDLAVESLLRDELIGLPTETVYGLASNALNDAATLKIYALKRRPVDHPLIAHIYDSNAVNHFATEVPEFALNLMQAFWPGPLTLILKKIDGIAGACTAGAPTIALRCPAHPVAQALLKRCQEVGIWGLAAPSANRFGRVSPTRAEHVAQEFGDTLTILNGGPSSVGIESTIVDCTRGAPIVLRPGMLTLEELSHAAKCPAVMAQRISAGDQKGDAGTPKASGTLESHYAPDALVRLLSTDEISARLQNFKSPNLQLAIWSRAPFFGIEAKKLKHAVMPDTPAECAKALFAQLRAFDALGMTEIWVERPPESPEWAGITDRLQRAAHSGTEHR